MPCPSLYHCGSLPVDKLEYLFKPAAEQMLLTFTPKEVLVWKTRGTQKTVMKRFNVDLQTDSARGGSSAARFGRIRDQTRLALIKSVQEFCKSWNPLIAGSGQLVKEYCALVGSGYAVIAATEPEAAMRETLYKVADQLEEKDLKDKARGQARFVEDLQTKAELLAFGDEIQPGLIEFCYSDGSILCEWCPVVQVLDLTDYGGLVGKKFW